MTGPTPARVPGAPGGRGAASPTRTRDDGAASAEARAAGGGAPPSSSAVFLGSRSHSGSLDGPRRREGAGGRRQWPGGAGAALPLGPGAGRRAGALRLRSAQGRRPPRPGERRGLGGVGRRRALTLTKSSMMGSLSSSFNPFSGTDNAMAGSAGLRGRRQLLLLRGCSSYGLLPRCASLDSPGV